MTSNTQQFRTRGTIAPRMVNEIGTINNSKLENQLTELTSLVTQLAIGQHQPITVVKACGICTSMEHPTDMCPTLQETELNHPKSVGAIGGYQYRKQPHANQLFEGQQFGRPPYQGSYAAQGFSSNRSMPQSQGSYQQSNSRHQVPPFNSNNSRRHHHQMPANNMDFQQNMSATIQDLKTQVGQLANFVGQLQSAGFGNLPSQTIPNPRGNVSIKLRSVGTELELDADSQAPQQARPIPIPFPSRTLSARKLGSDEELLKMFQKVENNIPLLDAIKQIPKYTKFLKELCVHKRKKMKGGVELGGIVSTLTKNDNLITGTRQALPKKCRDPKIFSIPCSIGDCTFADAMLDLGASINIMLTSIYKSLNYGDLEPTEMTIQLANRSIVQPLDVLQDILVQVDELIFPINFYVLDMKDKTPRKGSTLILGQPFFMTTKTKIDVHAGTLSIEFGDTLVQFNI
ncbi:hypothetical protein CR513_05106, partial [Mucuna pruriens]